MSLRVRFAGHCSISFIGAFSLLVGSIILSVSFRSLYLVVGLLLCLPGKALRSATRESKPVAVDPGSWNRAIHNVSNKYSISRSAGSEEAVGY